MFYVLSVVAIYLTASLTGTSDITCHSLWVFVALQVMVGVLCATSSLVMMRFMDSKAVERLWFVL